MNKVLVQSVVRVDDDVTRQVLTDIVFVLLNIVVVEAELDRLNLENVVKVVH